MQKQIELKKNMNKLYEQVEELRLKAKHKFVYESVLDFTGKRKDGA